MGNISNAQYPPTCTIEINETGVVMGTECHLVDKIESVKDNTSQLESENLKEKISNVEEDRDLIEEKERKQKGEYLGEFKIGDYVLRDGKKYKIVDIDDEEDPPDCTLEEVGSGNVVCTDLEDIEKIQVDPPDASLNEMQQS